MQYKICLCNGVASIQNSTQTLSSFNRRDARTWFQTSWYKRHLYHQCMDTTPLSAKERLLHVRISVWYMISFNSWTKIFMYIIFKYMLIFWWQNIVLALQNMLITTHLRSFHRYHGWYCSNSMCYSLILYPFELNGKKNALWG